MGSMTPEMPVATPSTPGGYFSLAITAIMALFVLSGALFGFKRGFPRSVIRLVTVIISAVAAGIMASSLVGSAAAFVDGLTMAEALEKLLASSGDTAGLAGLGLTEDMVNLLASFDAEMTLCFVQIIVAVAVVPIAFIVIFWVFKFVTVFIYWIITAIAGLRKRRKKIGSRMLGLLIGALQGAIIASVLLLPLAGISSVANDCIEVLSSDAPEAASEEPSAEGEDMLGELLDSFVGNPVLKTISALGGRAIFDSMTSITVQDTRHPAYDTAMTFVMIYSEIGSMGEIDFMAPSKEVQATLENTVEIISNDSFIATVASGLMRGVNTAVDNGALVIVAEEPMASFVSSLVDVFADSNKDNLEADLNTILHVYFILGDNNVLNSFGDVNALKSALTTKHSDNKTVIDYVVDELYLNPRTAHIVNSLTELSIKVMCESIGLSDDAYHIYENVKTGVNDVLALNEADFATREEYIGAVSNELNETLKANDIVLDQNTLDVMSNYIADNYSDISEISDEDINRALLSYYGALADGEITPDEIPDELPGTEGAE